MIGIDAGLDARVLAGTHHYRWPGQIRFMTCQRRVRLQQRLVDKAARAFPCGVGFRQQRRVAELWVLNGPTLAEPIEVKVAETALAPPQLHVSLPSTAQHPHHKR